jgi:hypothetical protein
MGVREIIQEALSAPREKLPKLALEARAAIGRGATLEAEALCRTVLTLSVSLSAFDSGHADLVRWLLEHSQNSPASLDAAERFAAALKDESLEALVKAKR